MKKNYLLLALLALFVSCQKEPDMGELDSDLLVLTDYDTKANFSSYTTYFLPDSIMIPGNGSTAPTWIKGDAVAPVISAIASNMTGKGYTRVQNKGIADLGIQPTFIQNTTYINYDPVYPYWWWGYPYPFYWGDWTGWYYPYPIVYSYNVGSLIAEIVDLKNPVTTGDKKELQVLWTAYMAGLMSGSSSIDTQRAVNAVNQAFVQSPYIKK